MLILANQRQYSRYYAHVNVIDQVECAALLNE